MVRHGNHHCVLCNNSQNEGGKFNICFLIQTSTLNITEAGFLAYLTSRCQDCLLTNGKLQAIAESEMRRMWNTSVVGYFMFYNGICNRVSTLISVGSYQNQLIKDQIGYMLASQSGDQDSISGSSGICGGMPSPSTSVSPGNQYSGIATYLHITVIEVRYRPKQPARYNFDPYARFHLDPTLG
jgi:hypothetical protein